MAAAAGIHPYKTAQQLYEEMTGAAKAEEAGPAVAHGLEQERRAFAAYQTLRMDGVRVEEGAGLRFLSASLPVSGYVDGLVYRGEQLEGVLEIKVRKEKRGKRERHIKRCLIQSPSVATRAPTRRCRISAWRTSSTTCPSASATWK